MFSTSKRFAVSGNDIVTTNRLSKDARVVSALPRKKEIAGMMPGLMDSAGLSNTSRMTMSGPLAFNYYLTGIVPEHEEALRRYYRDMYYYDAICGSMVDIMASFPFSDWTLTGADVDQLAKFDESMSRLNLRSLLPEITTSYMVDGKFVGTLVFNQKDKVFIDVLCHDPDNMREYDMPFYSCDPKIVVNSDERTKRFLADSTSPHVQKIKAMFSESFLNVLNSAAYELSPLTTLYLARKTLAFKPPTSFLKRVLPIYLLEKQMYRGTLVEAHKRQRSMLHIQAGDDNWEPTPEEFEALVGMFQEGEMDPLGAIIATHTSVQTSEIRAGGEFWKWTDMADVLVPYKLRALGISEAFLTADANYSNGETAMSVFMENADAFRNYVTYKIFTNKIFPIVALSNKFFRPGSDLAKDINKNHNLSALYLLNNSHDLILPKVQWHKKLDAKSEADPFDLLDKLTEKGVPIPLRMWAAAAKVDIDTLLHELEQDKDVRDRLTPYLKAVEGSSSEGGETTEMTGSEFAKLLETTPDLAGLHTKRKPLLSREFGELSEATELSKTGKKKYIYSQADANRKANENIAKAIRALNDPHHRKTVLARVSKRLGHIPDFIGVGK